MLALPLQPAIEVLLLFTGTLLILLELHRPGWILPGCVGLLAILLGFTSIARSQFSAFPMTSYALYALLAALGTRTANAFVTVGFVLGIFGAFASLAFMGGWPFVVFCLLCAAFIALLTEFLTRTARTARTNKFPPATSKQASPAQNPLD